MALAQARSLSRRHLDKGITGTLRLARTVGRDFETEIEGARARLHGRDRASWAAYCLARYHALHPRKWKACSACGKMFFPKHKNRYYCSHRCVLDANKASRERRDPTGERWRERCREYQDRVAAAWEFAKQNGLIVAAERPMKVSKQERKNAYERERRKRPEVIERNMLQRKNWKRWPGEHPSKTSYELRRRATYRALRELGLISTPKGERDAT